MIVLPVALLLLPSMAILATIAWGWRHGTLSETPQERYDWEFEQIVRRI
jgi:hypothetical protein